MPRRVEPRRGQYDPAMWCEPILTALAGAKEMTRRQIGEAIGANQAYLLPAINDMLKAGKSMLANAATAERLVAVQHGWHVETAEAAKLNFADKLDAFMWADHHRATGTDEWTHAAATLHYWADRLGVREKLEGVI